ncbi:MAG: arginine--tRNA ligase [Pirellulaceae bacterium]|nr:arginine--tRNA ligase [Pirellulaceae bacterium]
MNVLAELQSRFRPALESLVSDTAKVNELLDLIRVAQDPKFGDYQANFAMPLGKMLGKSPRDVATQIVAAAKFDDFVQQPEIAGPGFINLRLREQWVAAALRKAAADERLAVEAVKSPRTYVIDYSSPNVAKPMHVGHIRSTVIGDSLARTLRFLGHKVISDNHLGDWGTQFGMIIYGYKHFVDAAQFAASPVTELSRLYKLVSKLVDYRESLKTLPDTERRLAGKQAQALTKIPDNAAVKQAKEAIRKAAKQVEELAEDLASLKSKKAAVEQDAALFKLAQEHASIDDAILAETAKLHAGDAENLRLWHEFLPHCRVEIQKVYRRLDVKFDHEHGESFYHDRLAAVVEDMRRKGLAQESQGAVCVFLDGFEAPMIVQKKDGAFLYSTTDLATIAYRMETWKPEAILYVVDHRQSDHFDKLFAAAKKWCYDSVELQHIKFGTVMGKDGKPYKTRSGDTVGLEGLLDEAVCQALKVVSENDDAKPDGPELSADERRNISEVVGLGGLKYADLSHNRTTDYEFDAEKMLAKTGNTATYMQYSHARVRSIFARGGINVAALPSDTPLVLTHPAERALSLMLLRFAEALAETEADYMPHHLTAYLFDLAKSYFTFYESCPVLKADTAESRTTRLILSDLTARTIKQGLSLLGIGVVEKM